MATKQRMELPTEEQLSAGSKALKALATTPKQTPTGIIWQTLGDDIQAARKAGYGWEEIAQSLTGAGVSISAASLRATAPKATGKENDSPARKRNQKAATAKAEEANG